jgi:sugar lactone lactonase YvrE
MPKPIAVALVLLIAVAAAHAGSYYTSRPADSKAVYLTPQEFGVHPDGAADDSEGIQRAIDKVQETTREGIVFVPEGRYRLTRTIYVWPGIRLIGYGAVRPVFVLGEHTPGFQDAAHENYMVFFAGRRPQARDGGPGVRPPDANPGTFYSAMSNIDMEIAAGNPGAVGVRGTYAQHSFLAHMEFRLHSGIAGVHDTGNVMEDVKFHGGQYGIWTRKPSPGWQFMAVDVAFEGQREAAIRDVDAGLTLVRPHFKRVPNAISIDAGYPDQLWIKDGIVEDVTGPAVVVSLEQNPRTQINMENVVCRGVPTFTLFRESGKKLAGPGAIYRVTTFSHGLTYADIKATPEVQTQFEAVPLAEMPRAPKSDIPPLPPGNTWINIRDLGAKGDGTTDDTAAFREVIARHKAIYVPSGHYVVSDTLTLRPDTVLLGLHPSTTQIKLLDRTPAFQGVGAPKPVIEAPQDGTNIVTGIGVYTNGINPRAVGVKWMASTESLMNDVRFLGGHGTMALDGRRENPYNNDHTADPDLNRRWDGQYPSLWVTNGGGGTFFDLWTPSTFAQAGMLVSDTSTEGRVYQMSSEHHVRHEVQFRNVSNWQIYALQTEEERGESGFALPLEIENSRNITIANLYMYRVISSYQPFPWAVKLARSSDIRFRNVHCFSNSKVSFDSTIYDQTSGTEFRQREFASLTLRAPVALASTARPEAVEGPAVVRPSTASLGSSGTSAGLPARRTKIGLVGDPGEASAAADPISRNTMKTAPNASLLPGPGVKLEKLAGGFYNASGGAVAPNGNFYFVDTRWHRIYKWDVARREIVTVGDAPLDPVNLAFDRSGNLLVISYSGEGTVYSFRPDAGNGQITKLNPMPAVARPGLTPVLPVSDWFLQRDKNGPPLQRTNQYLSPDQSTFIAATEGFVNGATSWGIKSSDLLRAFSLAPAMSGKPFYFTSESEVTTWRATVNADGNLSEVTLFANQGGEGVTTDAEGNVYIVAGQIYVYSPSGQLMKTIEVPERPTQAIFGGQDGRSLFILGRTSLYAVSTDPGK